MTLLAKITFWELWEEHLKDPIIALDKALKCLENPYQGLLLKFLRKVTRAAMACSWVSAGILQTMWERPFWEGVWPCLDPWDSVRLRKASTHWIVPRKPGHTASSFSFS